MKEVDIWLFWTVNNKIITLGFKISSRVIFFHYSISTFNGTDIIFIEPTRFERIWFWRFFNRFSKYLKIYLTLTNKCQVLYISLTCIMLSPQWTIYLIFYGILADQLPTKSLSFSWNKLDSLIDSWMKFNDDLTIMSSKGWFGLFHK